VTGVPAAIPCQHLANTPALEPASVTLGKRRTGKSLFDSLNDKNKQTTAKMADHSIAKMKIF